MLFILRTAALTSRRLKRALRNAKVALAVAAFLPCLAIAAGTGAARSPIAPGAPIAPIAQQALRFPQDEGAHPEWKTEWWYVTGWLKDVTGAPRGFQITFFRNRGGADASHTSRFAPRQVLLAHAAVSDPAQGHIVHDERVARSGFGLAEFHTDDTGVHIDDWSLQRTGDGSLEAHIAAQHFNLQLHFKPTQLPLLEGDQGLSHKGHDARAFSWYYSLPHLDVSGTLGGAPVHGEAWLDHEWSNAYIAEGAQGWDWTGLNFVDGSALMAFRMRGAQGQTIWSSGTWRDTNGHTSRLGNGEVEFVAGRRWTSPSTGASYPIEWTLRWPDHEVQLKPLMDNQEMDTRTTTGTAYWEGAVTASRQGTALAHGYLELTGYWKPLQF